MRRLAAALMAISILCLLSIGMQARDDDKILKEHFEFTSDVMVGDTLVKKGFYLVKYNTETGMVKIVDEGEGNKVIATAKATVKTHEKDFERDEILTKTTPKGQVLTGLRLGGKKEELTLTESVASSKEN
jgi:hypothetical protein